jgi:hypothetical protein
MNQRLGLFRIASHGQAANAPVVVRCPGCGRTSTLDPIGSNDVQGNLADGGNVVFGQRRCPVPDCGAHVFFAIPQGEAPICWPPETLDFDHEGLPDGVLQAFDEAIRSHSNACYAASGMMIRKTLEEICADQNATGNTLFDRLEALKGAVLVPPDLLDGLHDLRLLGNDAAHIESRTYNEVGKDEVELGIELTKLFLQAVYQTKSVVERLRARRSASE